jgi:xanthine dehydrogenase accessory factor
MAIDSQEAWIEALSALRAERRACAMVVVTGVRGSGPREAGARMIVARRDDGAVDLVAGTIGGGNLEKLAIDHCAELLARGEALSESVAYPLSEKAGQCCGGEVTLFFETFPWKRRRIAIFGAGHVAQAIAGLAPYLSADVVLIDSREEREIRPKLVEKRAFELLLVDHPEVEVDELAGDALVLVMTHSHALDLEIVARAIPRGFPYLGLIGSERKWERFRKRLEARGFNATDIARVHCPIGVSKNSKEPAAIAISVAAELIDVMQTTATR